MCSINSSLTLKVEMKGKLKDFDNFILIGFHGMGCTSLLINLEKKSSIGFSSPLMVSNTIELYLNNYDLRIFEDRNLDLMDHVSSSPTFAQGGQPKMISFYKKIEKSSLKNKQIKDPE
ncbi:hypothetical protein BpHYR1_042192 [Brachionus plicatilis]|uniref:Uncharacterized protein n=1 Tax=Brachionus plicatilis TaxID=10195 RepID=A0A3M7SGQ7_BRAPC|nr:hypothetical protein BpHYR1_042192 [Brachionus plicatilis]